MNRQARQIFAQNHETGGRRRQPTGSATKKPKLESQRRSESRSNTPQNQNQNQTQGQNQSRASRAKRNEAKGRQAGGTSASASKGSEPRGASHQLLERLAKDLLQNTKQLGLFDELRMKLMNDLQIEEKFVKIKREFKHELNTFCSNNKDNLNLPRSKLREKLQTNLNRKLIAAAGANTSSSHHQSPNQRSDKSSSTGERKNLSRLIRDYVQDTTRDRRDELRELFNKQAGEFLAKNVTIISEPGAESEAPNVRAAQLSNLDEAELSDSLTDSGVYSVSPAPTRTGGGSTSSGSSTSLSSPHKAGGDKPKVHSSSINETTIRTTEPPSGPKTDQDHHHNHCDHNRPDLSRFDSSRDAIVDQLLQEPLDTVTKPDILSQIPLPSPPPPPPPDSPAKGGACDRSSGSDRSQRREPERDSAKQCGASGSRRPAAKSGSGRQAAPVIKNFKRALDNRNSKIKIQIRADSVCYRSLRANNSNSIKVPDK